MKKKTVIIFIAAAMAAALTGCGADKDADTAGTDTSVRDDLVEFVGTEIPAAETRENEIMSAYNAYFSDGQTVDTDALLTDLNDNLLPEYEEFLAEVEAIETATDEVASLKDMYYDAMNTQYQALQKVQQAITDNDTDVQKSAQTLATSANEKYTQYNDAVYALAQQENVTLNGEIGTTVTTEMQGTTEAGTEAIDPDMEVVDDNATMETTESTDTAESTDAAGTTESSEEGQ